MAEEKTKDPNRLTWLNYLIIALVVATFYFYKDAHEGILNYPDYLRYIGWAVLFVALVIMRFKKFIAAYTAMQTMGERLFYLVLSLAGSLVGTLMLATLALSPFNYYNVYAASKSHADSIRCNIDDVYLGKQTTEGREPNVIKFHFMGQEDSILTHDDMAQIAYMHELHLTSAYRLVLATHKALLGSYVLQAWRLEQKKDTTNTTQKKN